MPDHESVGLVRRHLSTFTADRHHSDEGGSILHNRASLNACAEKLGEGLLPSV